MSESIVVVAGPLIAAAVGLPTLSGNKDSILNDAHYSKVLSPKEYGNFLPDFWEYAKDIAVNALEKKPSIIHKNIAEKRWPVITQNIGGIHLRAGSYPVVEVNGQLFKARCMRCQTEFDFPIENYEALEEGEVPTCVKCGKNRVRPDIVLPGENIKHRRLAEDFVKDSNTTLFIGVESDDPQVQKWVSKSATSILIHPEGGSGFDKVIKADIYEWALQGCPIR